MTRRLATVCTVILTLALAAQALGQVSFESLLREMVDRDEIARWPDPAYTCSQFSSYDRASNDPGGAGWWANDDRNQFLRVETDRGREEHVLMDDQGPGAVVRIWTTWHGPAKENGPGRDPFSNGTLRVYFDGSDEPTIEAPIASIVGGDYLAGKPISQSVSPLTEPGQQGHNTYLPLPYAKGCKVTYETKSFMDTRRGEVLYYQINYRSYEDGVEVRTFRTEDVARSRELLGEVRAKLIAAPEKVAGRPAAQLTASLAPGESVTAKIDGGKAIRQMAMRLGAADLNQALRSTVVRIAFDGQETVACPVGDFFVSGYQIHPYRTWYTSAEKDGTLTCNWVMPFRRNATITVTNHGGQAVTIEQGDVIASDWQWGERDMYFHADWKQWADLATQTNPAHEPQGAFDLHWIRIDGRGVWVGDAITLYNQGSRWWGEGDEKIFVDDEAFPSHIGTGTEDYYGYAWCRPEPFSSPFHAQPIGDGNLWHPGYTVNTRVRLLDAITFEKSLQFDLEMWHWEKTTIDYAPAMFWYGSLDARTNVPDVLGHAQRRVTMEPKVQRVVRRVAGAIEGETMEIVNVGGGRTEVQDLPGWQWSQDKQLWWLDGQPGQSLVLSFDVRAADAGRKGVYLGTTQAPDYGIFRVALNGTVLREGVDLYREEGRSTELFLGVAEIKQGANRLEVTLTGANPKAQKRHMFGLDYLKLIKPSASWD